MASETKTNERLHQPQAQSVNDAPWRRCICNVCSAKYFEYLDGVALDVLSSRNEKPLVSSWRRGRANVREIEQKRQEWKEWLADNKAWAARVRAKLERNRLQKKGCISQEPGESTWPHSD